MRKYAFEKLEVWQLARDLAIEVYRITNTFPQEEKWGITMQMRKAVVSTPSNIAEGVSRSSRKEKRRFLEIAYGSLMELINQAIISHHLGYLKETTYTDLRVHCEKLSNKLNAFHKSV